MTRTQIQLPDDLYKRAKRFSEEREISLAEIARRGMELFLARYPERKPSAKWQLPKVSCGTKVPLDRLHDLSADEESMRALPH